MYLYSRDDPSPQSCLNIGWTWTSCHGNMNASTALTILGVSCSVYQFHAVGVGRLEIRGLGRGGGAQESRGRHNYFRRQATKGPEQMSVFVFISIVCFFRLILLPKTTADLWNAVW